MIEIREYIDDRGRSPFRRWFDDLDALAANKVRTALARMETAICLTSEVSGGVYWNTAYTSDQDTGSISGWMVTLWSSYLVAAPRGASRMISAARNLWQEYRRRKRQEE